MIKAVLFDVDGVILSGEKFSEYLARKHGISVQRDRDFFRGELRQCLAGASDLEDVLRAQLISWNIESALEDILEFWHPRKEWVNQQVLDAVAGLRSRGLLCGLATNQDKRRIGYLLEELGFAELFDRVFASSELGVCKPEPLFFERILEKLSPLAASEILYWDDDLKNINVARDLGIQAEHYTGYEAFFRKMPTLA